MRPGGWASLRVRSFKVKTVNLETQRDGAATKTRIKTLKRRGSRGSRGFFGVVTLAKPYGRPESKTINLETQRDGAATKTRTKTLKRRGSRGSRGFFGVVTL